MEIFFLTSLFNSTYVEAGELQKRITELAHSGKLEILLETSDGLKFVNINNVKYEGDIILGQNSHFHIDLKALSHSGRYIAYTLFGYYLDKGTIKIFDVATGNTEDIATFKEIAGLAISPDDKKIAFVATYDDLGPYNGVPMSIENIAAHFKQKTEHDSKVRGLFVIDLKSREIEKLIEKNVAYIENTAWSPDGSKILYQAGDQSHAIIDLETRASKKILDKDYSYTSWTHDSKRIIYLNDLYVDAKDSHYYSVDLNGQDKQLFLENKELNKISLFSGVYKIQTPIYTSPNGEFLLYGRSAGFKGSCCEAYVMDTSTKETIPVGYGEIGGWTFSSQFLWPKNESSAEAPTPET